MLILSWMRVTLAVVRRPIGYGVLALAALCMSYQPPLAAAQEQPRVEEAPDGTISAWDYFRAWYRLNRRLQRLWLDAWRGEAPPDTAACGDGELQRNEQCDDGNVAPSDGCDARCELEDDAATPGDDRPGFVLCASSEDPSLTCSPEQQCCRSPENVCDSMEQDCKRPNVTVAWGDDCDGPEDCEQDMTCVRSKYGASCTAASAQQGYPVLCHADSDCAFLPETLCSPDGICVAL